MKPGNPDGSYMARKIKGGQNPLGEMPLAQATIDAIRQWITNGAPNAPAAVAAAQAIALQTMAPLDKASVKAAPARILVTFTHAVDASLVNDTTVSLERVVGLADAGAQAMSITAALAPANSAVLLITPNTALDPGVYRVTLRGAGGDALADMNAATLGKNTSIEFNVEPAR